MQSNIPEGGTFLSEATRRRVTSTSRNSSSVLRIPTISNKTPRNTFSLTTEKHQGKIGVG